MRDDVVLRRALPLGRGLGRIVATECGSDLGRSDEGQGQQTVIRVTVMRVKSIRDSQFCGTIHKYGKRNRITINHRI